jgi:excinuclease ABC subunit C
MREALTRRLKRLDTGDARFAARPDLILVDGGSGHVSTAMGVLNEMDIDIPVAGMVKNDRHKTSSLLTSDGEDIILSARPELYRLISSIQDEAHRFAISYSKKLAEKRLSLSALDEIRGVGKKRKMELLTHFKSFRNIKTADVDALLETPGMDARTARAVYNYFHDNEGFRTHQEDPTGGEA